MTLKIIGGWKIVATLTICASIFLSLALFVVCQRGGYFSKVYTKISGIWYENFYDGWEYISDGGITITGDSIETENAGQWSKLLRDSIEFISYKNYAIGGTCLSVYGSGEDAIASDERLAEMTDLGDLILMGTGTNDWGITHP